MNTRHANKPALPREDASEDFKQGTTEHRQEVKQEKPSPRAEIEKQMEANNLWIAQHREDAKGVHEREMANAELSHRLIDMDTAAREAGRTAEQLKA